MPISQDIKREAKRFLPWAALVGALLTTMLTGVAAWSHYDTKAASQAEAIIEIKADHDRVHSEIRADQQELHNEMKLDRQQVVNKLEEISRDINAMKLNQVRICASNAIKGCKE